MMFKSYLALAVAPLMVLAASSGAASRNYDCSKSGNANKAACKMGTAKPTSAKTAPGKPKVVAATPAKPRNYDCTKLGNANKAACKGAARPASMVPPPKPHAAAASATGTGTGPQGATAKCRDNTYSRAKTHAGACSHHGGVASWL